MKFAASLAALAFGFVVTAAAAPVTRDLGRGLVYARVHVLPADLPGDTKPAPLVLDLRYVDTPAEPAAALQAWLRFHATPATPVFVLLNPDTGGALRTAVARLAGTPGLLTIASGGLPGDLAVDPSPGEERTAYDALEHDTAIETLVTRNAGKPRHDEASLATSATGDNNSDATDDTDTRDDTTEPAPPPFDAALAQAIGAHRALLALGRLPAHD